ncbi:glycosyltransferase family 2 protein [Nesterenkonia aurantiaca]|uniref:Glycosyltransferase 2-like domain-containing protein n=1 Tax=Nesterenkonia aurantiaca TaxID=1436010 RepID=A0A4R7FVA4_9MICC|nr:glycosyltransferase family 2 protein [Nesterenkonia aurantiaca]TDS82631.1 hypothetical protein EV640_1144 [Nesterenkonia aurantiaca]
MVLLAAIVNYRSSTYLEACLNSLAEAGVDRAAVVDNYSSDEERAEVRKVAERSQITVTVVLSDSNPGFGAAVNRAVRALKALETDLIWIVNPDAVVTREAAVGLSSRILHGRVDVVSPLIVTGDPVTPSVWFGGGHIDTRAGRTIHLHLGDDPRTLSGLQDVTFVTGAAPMLMAKTFDALGGFREDLFLYWEDADLSRRATAADMRLAVDLDSIVWHAVGGSGDAEGRSAAYYRFMQRNRLIVCSRWTSRWNLVIGMGSVETVKLLLRPLKERFGRFEKFQAGVAGLLDGFANAATRPDDRR